MMEADIALALALGFTTGLRHALDPDHLVAVSTIVSEHKSITRSSLVGTFWGVGHTASLFAVGVVVIILRTSIPPGVAHWLEVPVGVMLIALGLNTTWRALRDRGVKLHTHVHSHDDGSPHSHIHIHHGEQHDHRHRMFKIGRRPFLVGLVHGVAGSAVITVFALVTLPSAALGLAYITVFGIGSIGGMLLMSAAISLPFAMTARRFTGINAGVRLAAGLFSISFGAWKLFLDVSA